MTAQLERAIEKAAQLPESQQDALAILMMEELEAEKRWNDAFAGSQDLLSRMADEALREHRLGETKILNGDA